MLAVKEVGRVETGKSRLYLPEDCGGRGGEEGGHAGKKTCD